jgi:hypothetical protein
MNEQFLFPDCSFLLAKIHLFLYYLDFSFEEEKGMKDFCWIFIDCRFSDLRSSTYGEVVSTHHFSLSLWDLTISAVGGTIFRFWGILSSPRPSPQKHELAAR